MEFNLYGTNLIRKPSYARLEFYLFLLDGCRCVIHSSSHQVTTNTEKEIDMDLAKILILAAIVLAFAYLMWRS